MKELKKAENSALVYIQRETFPEEIKLLNSQKPVKKSSPLYRLDPVIINGLLCINHVSDIRYFHQIRYSLLERKILDH